MDPDDRGLMGMSYERSYDPISGEIDTGGNIENLQSLLKYGLRGQYGPAGSQFLASRIQPLQQRFEIERPGGSFVDYFKNKFNLGL